MGSGRYRFTTSQRGDAPPRRRRAMRLFPIRIAFFGRYHHQEHLVLEETTGAVNEAYFTIFCRATFP